MEVFKFGGASVLDDIAIRNLGKIIDAHKSDELVIVVSAMGKTTNALEEVVNTFYYGTGDAFRKLQNLKNDHLEIARKLDLRQLIRDGILEDLFVEAEWLLEDKVHDTFDYIYDQIVAIGELLSTRLVHAYLETIGLATVWIDARDVIKTDDTYRAAKVDWELTSRKIDQFIRPAILTGRRIVIAGFIASTLENNTITLGREGSDYSAAILTAILEARALTVWKDVPGIMTCDPHLFEDARLIPKIDYKEAIEMTYYGAKVLHPRTIKPLMDKNIPLFVRSFSQPDLNGTVVASYPDVKYPPVMVMLEHQSLLQLFTRDFTFVVEDHFSEIFQLAVKHKIRIHLLENLAVSLSLVVQSDAEHVDAFVVDLLIDFKVVRTDQLMLCTIRHFEKSIVDEVRKKHKVYIEEYNATTAQLVLGKEELSL
jgi:aspartate kinase